MYTENLLYVQFHCQMLLVSSVVHGHMSWTKKCRHIWKLIRIDYLKLFLGNLTRRCDAPIMHMGGCWLYSCSSNCVTILLTKATLYSFLRLHLKQPDFRLNHMDLSLMSLLFIVAHGVLKSKNT